MREQIESMLLVAYGQGQGRQWVTTNKYGVSFGG